MRNLILTAAAVLCLSFQGNAVANNGLSANYDLMELEMFQQGNGISQQLAETIIKYVCLATDYSESCLWDMYRDGALVIEKQNGSYKVVINTDGGLAEIFVIDNL